jgi:hypothetical protein
MTRSKYVTWVWDQIFYRNEFENYGSSNTKEKKKKDHLF